MAAPGFTQPLVQQQSQKSNVVLLDSPPANVVGLQHDDIGIRSSAKQPFLFHLTQDFLAAAVNFLFNFMI